MGEKQLHDGCTLGCTEKKTFGYVYMRAVEKEFNTKYPGRDFDEMLWDTCGLSVIYLEGNNDFFHLGEFIQKMGLNEKGIKEDCERQGFDYAKEIGSCYGREEWRNGGVLRILGSSDAEAPEKSPCLLGLCLCAEKQKDMLVLHLWTLDVEDGVLWRLQELPVSELQAFYEHSSGVYPVDVPCPPDLAEQVWNVFTNFHWNGYWEGNSRNAEKLDHEFEIEFWITPFLHMF